MSNQPWAVSDPKSYPVLTQDIEVDVLVIGGGISGVTAAYLLKQAGKTVALLERSRIGGGETGHTTAHISYPPDVRSKDLVGKFGAAHAQAVFDAGYAAAMQISKIAGEAGIECELQTVPGYLFAAADADQEAEDRRLHEEAHLAAEWGFDADYVESAEVVHRPALRYANLMKFHPGKYVAGLAQRIPGDGCHIFEESNVEQFGESDQQVSCNGHTVRYSHVFLATHVPLQGNTSTIPAAIFQTKLAGYSTYALRARIPSGTLPEALFWDTSDPYLYIRTDRGPEDDCYVVIGGEDHKTGQEADTEACYARLQKSL